MRVRGRVAYLLIVVAVAVAALGAYRHQPFFGLAAVGIAVVAFLIAYSPHHELQLEAVEASVIVDPNLSHDGALEHPASDPITDPLTGLMNDIFFAGLIGTKVATARRRLWPVSVVLLQAITQADADPQAEARDQAIYEFANVIRVTIRSADVACRVGVRTFALILDDTDEDGAAWVAERIQVAQARRGDTSISKVCAGVASYPSHGIEPTDILVTAKQALAKASAKIEGTGLGLVIVAPQKPI
ncbi:MAG: diguanylate cyclase [Ferrimicrobium sp.]